MFCRICCLFADLHLPSERKQFRFVVAVKPYSLIPRTAVNEGEKLCCDRDCSGRAGSDIAGI